MNRLRTSLSGHGPAIEDAANVVLRQVWKGGRHIHYYVYYNIIPGILDPIEDRPILESKTPHIQPMDDLRAVRKHMADAYVEYREDWKISFPEWYEQHELDAFYLEKDRKAMAKHPEHVEVRANMWENLQTLEELRKANWPKSMEGVEATARNNLKAIEDEVGYYEVELWKKQGDDWMNMTVEKLKDMHSKKNVVDTLESNVDELSKQALVGKGMVETFVAQDEKEIKTQVTKWLADKLDLAREVLQAFIGGYQEGKRVGLTVPSFVEIMMKESIEAEKEKLEAAANTRTSCSDPFTADATDQSTVDQSPVFVADQSTAATDQPTVFAVDQSPAFAAETPPAFPADQSPSFTAENLPAFAADHPATTDHPAAQSPTTAPYDDDPPTDTPHPSTTASSPIKNPSPISDNQKK